MMLPAFDSSVIGSILTREVLEPIYKRANNGSTLLADYLNDAGDRTYEALMTDGNELAARFRARLPVNSVAPQPEVVALTVLNAVKALVSGDWGNFCEQVTLSVAINAWAFGHEQAETWQDGDATRMVDDLDRWAKQAFAPKRQEFGDGPQEPPARQEFGA